MQCKRQTSKSKLLERKSTESALCTTLECGTKSRARIVSIPHRYKEYIDRWARESFETFMVQIFLAITEMTKNKLAIIEITFKTLAFIEITTINLVIIRITKEEFLLCK